MRNIFKKQLLCILIILGLFTSSYAMDTMKNYRTVPIKKAQLLQKGDEKEFCPICGMDLHKFYKTNHAATYKGHKKQYCSIACEVEDEVINKNKLTDFKVVDNTSLKFISSKKAFFVVSSNKPATMSIVSKYAFAKLSDALSFQKKNGGNIMDFDELHIFVKKSLDKDIQATKKRQAKAIKKGAKIYNKMCKKTSKIFSTVASAKSFLLKSKICGNIKGKKHQAVALYLKNRK